MSEELTAEFFTRLRDYLIRHIKYPAENRCPICGRHVHVYSNGAAATACSSCLEKRQKLFNRG